MNRYAAYGFTLIELMTVVVVIAILAAVAYPSYQDHIVKAKRAEGKTALLKAAQVLERWYSDKATYGNTPAPPLETSIDLAPLFGRAATLPVYSGEDAADARSAYTITAAVGACGAIQACFLLTAAPNSPFTDPTCGNLTLASTGTRSWANSGDATTATKCKW